MSFRILHFSDLHLIKDDRTMDTLLMYLSKSIEEIHKKENIDLIIFTGDLIDKGGVSFGSIKEGFNEFENIVIKPIIEKINLPKERFIFVPGNHDTENDKDKSMTKIGLLYSNSHSNFEEIISLKNNSSYKKSILERTKVFKEFEKDFYSDKLCDKYQFGDFESNFKFNIRGKNIGITSLNSVWLCGLDNDKEFYLGVDQLVNSQLFLSDCDIKIVTSHLGYDLLTEAESKKVKDIITEKYDLNLSGHTHSLDNDFIVMPPNNYCMNVTSAGTLCNNNYAINDEYRNSFQIIDIISKEEFVIRKYHQKNGMDFILDLNFGSSGVWHQKYKVTEAQKIAEIDRIKEEQEMQNKLIERIFPLLPIDLAIEHDKETFMSGEFIQTTRNNECISLLLDPNIKNLRLLSVSGVGKTRIVGEAYKKMKNVFYSKTTEKIDNGIIYILTHFDNGIIVIDDCSIDKYYRVNRLITEYQKPFKLITIYNVITKEEVGDETNVFFLDAVDNKEVVDAIIEREGIIDIEVKNQIKEYSDGISLMAIELIKAYKNIGRVQLLPQKKLWLDYLLNPNGQIAPPKRAVLNSIALFNPLGCMDGKKDEYDFVINHPEINHIYLDKPVVEDCFNTTIREFSHRRLLDIRANSVNVRPRPLAEWLAEEWLQKTSHESWEKIIEAFEAAGPLGERLTDQMKNRLRSLSSNEAKKLLDQLNRIPFHNEKIVLTKTGSRLIFSMSVVSQVAVAENLFSLFEHKPIAYFKEKIKGDVRRNIVWALEEACVDADAFEKACILLGILSMAENEQISNNSTGVFLEKFRLLLSGTQADIEKKENVIQYFIQKGIDYHPLMVKAISSAFSTRSIHHMLTYSEKKLDIKPKSTINYSELRRYWNFCKDSLIKIGDNINVSKEIYIMLPNHVYDLLNGGCAYILFELINYFAPKFDNDWDKMRHSLNLIKKYNPLLYSNNKEKIDVLINETFAPRTFIKRVKASMEDIDRRNIGVDNIFNIYMATLRPFGDEFIKERIYDSKDFDEIANDKNFHCVWMIIASIELMNQINCREDVYSSFLHYIKSKPKDYSSLFLETFMSHDTDKEFLSSFANKLIENGYYYMACGVLGMIEDNTFTQLQRILTLLRTGKIESLFINYYLRFVSFDNLDYVFKVNDMLFDNNYVDKTKVTYPHLFENVWPIDKEKIIPYLSKIQDRLLDFNFKDNNVYFSKEVVDHIEDILRMFDVPEFAKKINHIVIEYLEPDTHFINNPFEDVYLCLLPKYQDDILDDLINVLSMPLEQNMFYMYMYNNLGSGFGYGKGPLFQCNEERLKKACKEHPEVLPERFASMCPVCNYDENGEMIGLSDFFLWLVDNFGDNKMVLDSFSMNFGTYSYSGVGSMKGYFVNRQNLFKPLFFHSNVNVVNWAKSMYKHEGMEVEYQQKKDEYNDMICD